MCIPVGLKEGITNRKQSWLEDRENRSQLCLNRKVSDGEGIVLFLPEISIACCSDTADRSSMTEHCSVAAGLAMEWATASWAEIPILSSDILVGGHFLQYF